MSSRFWIQDNCDVAVQILRGCSDYSEAIKLISKRLKRPVTKDALTNAFRANSFDPPCYYLGADLDDDFEEVEEESEILEEEEPKDADVALLMKAIKKKPHTLRSLCDEVFDSSPKQVEKIVDRAIKAGYAIDLHDSEVGFKSPGPSKKPTSIEIHKPGKEHQIGVFSDVHVGSEYHLKGAWVDHIHHCHDQGINEFFCPGDLLEGCYRHARWELTHSGWERQAQEALNSIPQIKGVKYHFIDGNHDFTFTEQIGMESGRGLVRLAREQGRDDIFFHGSRGAMFQYGETRIEMWHPKKGNGYALSYQLQNHIRDTEPQDRPQILLAGHWHQFVQLQQGGVYAVSCGTFQHGKGPFGKSLGGTTAIGGVIVRWSMDEKSNIREFYAQHRPYPYIEADITVEET